MLGSAVPMTRSLRCIVPLVAALLLASCGGGDGDEGDPAQRASASSDVNALLRSTFANLSQDEVGHGRPQGADRAARGEGGRRPGHRAPVRPVRRARAPTSCRSSPSRRELESGGQTFNAGATYDGLEGLRHADGHAVRGVRPRDAAVRGRLRAVAQEPQDRPGRPRPRQPRHRLHEVAAERHQRGRGAGRRREDDQDLRRGRRQAGHRRPREDHREGVGAQRAGRERAHPAEADAAAEGRGRGRDQEPHGRRLHGRRRHDPAPADGQRRSPGRRVEGRRGRAAGHHVHEGRVRSRRSPLPPTRSPSQSC